MDYRRNLAWHSTVLISVHRPPQLFLDDILQLARLCGVQLVDGHQLRFSGQHRAELPQLTI